MNAQFWMGIAIGSLGAWAFLILTLLAHHRGRRAGKNLSAGANDLLRERNAIGQEQVRQLKAIAAWLEVKTRRERI